MEMNSLYKYVASLSPEEREQHKGLIQELRIRGLNILISVAHKEHQIKKDCETQQTKF